MGSLFSKFFIGKKMMPIIGMDNPIRANHRERMARKVSDLQPSSQGSGIAGCGMRGIFVPSRQNRAFLHLGQALIGEAGIETKEGTTCLIHFSMAWIRPPGMRPVF